MSGLSKMGKIESGKERDENIKKAEEAIRKQTFTNEEIAKRKKTINSAMRMGL